MTTALTLTQNFTHPLDGTTITNLYARLLRFSIDSQSQKYELVIGVWVNQTAWSDGRTPVHTLIYRCDDGKFPDWATAFADVNFQTPLFALRDWIYEESKTAHPAVFGGAVDIP
jgi:hypothetical protein